MLDTNKTVCRNQVKFIAEDKMEIALLYTENGYNTSGACEACNHNKEESGSTLKESYGDFDKRKIFESSRNVPTLGQSLNDNIIICESSI